MRRYFSIILIIGVLFAIWMILGGTNQVVDISSEYSDGKITTKVAVKGINDITSTEFRYKTFFLEQYVNVEPRVETYYFPSYKQNHTYELSSDLFQGKKDILEIEVAITYDDGTQEIIEKEVIEGIKENIYKDLVIRPEIEGDKVYYRADGLTAIIDKELFDNEIIFYSELNSEYPNISVGFHKDYTIYPVKSFGIIPKTDALEGDHEGFSEVEFTIEPGANESYLVVEYGMFDLVWDGLYPYDLEGNKVFYEGKEGDTQVSLIIDNKPSEISNASHEKYKEMLKRIPNIEFVISRE